jgi:hypothetical protein
VLLAAYPHMRGVLFDLPQVVAFTPSATTRPSRLERPIDAYVDLMRHAGLRCTAITPGAFDLQILEGAPA